MKILIEKRYMLLPISENACKKKLLLRDAAGKVRVELDLRLSAEPDFVMPYDLRAFVGETMDLSFEPEGDLVPVFADSPDDVTLYREAQRPTAHFSAPRGWINDPNGFVYYEGQYHLFYQHNPVDTCWGNMHWGHAVSRDLCHWTPCDEVLFPDETGTMFSGSAVVDERNLTGLQENEYAPLLLYYTAAGDSGHMSRGVAYTQRLAYSVDGGKTFKKYPRPMVEAIAAGNRDPKVIWCEETGCYIMALYLIGSEFMLLHSQNLLDWQAVQRITLENENECPDFYLLECDHQRYWVLMGAHDRYLIGHIEGRLFVPDKPIESLHGGMSYAAQSCFGLKDGRRVRFGWNRSTIHHAIFNGSMTTPQEMTLKSLDGRVCLCALPCAEFESLRGAKSEGVGQLMLSGRANEIILNIPAEGKRVILLFGLAMTLEAGRLISGGEERTVAARGGFVTLRLIQDVHAVEIYIGSGEDTMLLAHSCDALLNCVVCEGAEITAWPLENIWTGKENG